LLTDPCNYPFNRFFLFQMETICQLIRTTYRIKLAKTFFTKDYEV
jgi:hypothetical protein